MKKLFMFAIPLSVCNLRCHYCYLTKRSNNFEGVIPEMKYTPEEVAYAMRPGRVGGPGFFNLCADGETLLTPGLNRYVGLLAEEGHYIEIVSNMVLTKHLDKVLSLGREALGHVEFKCSFHYLQLRERGLLETFTENVNRAYDAGASITVEITPSDELIPYIDEVKDFSLRHFGALPHVTIARDDSTRDIERLTSLSREEYDRIWSSFDSGFFDFKAEIFGVRRREFCYAGSWSYYVNMATGDAVQCYGGAGVGNLFSDPDSPLPEKPIGRCPIAHCYNGHAFLTMGLIPGLTNVRFGDIRDREREDGSHWLQPGLKSFFNEVLVDSNVELSDAKKRRTVVSSEVGQLAAKGKQAVGRFIR